MISFEHALSKLLFLAKKIDVEEVNLEEAEKLFKFYNLLSNKMLYLKSKV